MAITDTLEIDLGEIDGKKVTRVSIAVTNAGDGLSDAMKIDPEIFHMGETVILAIECAVRDIKFKPIPDSDEVERVHVLRAGAAVKLTTESVRAAINAQRAKIQKAQDDARGRMRLLDDEPDHTPEQVTQEKQTKRRRGVIPINEQRSKTATKGTSSGRTRSKKAAAAEVGPTNEG
jgi:hypothetical protein